MLCQDFRETPETRKGELDIGIIRAQLDTYTSNNNGVLPADNAVFFNDIIDQLELGYYKKQNGDQYDAADIKGAQASITMGAQDKAIIYINKGAALVAADIVANEIVTQDEIFIFGGRKCNTPTITGANLGAAGAAGAITADTRNAIVVIYKTEGESVARCEDNV